MMQETDTSIAKVSQLHSITADFLKKRLSEKGFDDFASSHGYILYQLSKNPEITMKELSAKINRDKSTTTVLVRKLEQAGLVKVTVDSNDKRNKLLALTSKGTEYNQMTQELSEELLATFYKGFSEDEKRDFCGYLNRIKDNFTRTSDS
ncbi:MAG: MarR family transcriptional regulator [Treponema sp.]|nr:MarR family transcriptional regulator [Treponema sp.]